MDIKEFIIRIVEAIVWPVSIIILILSFKDQITKLFNLEDLKFKDLKIKFKKQIEELDKSTSKELDKTTSKQITDKSDKLIRSNIRSELNNNIRIALLKAWNYINNKAYEYAKIIGISNVSNDLIQFSATLSEQEIISTELYESIIKSHQIYLTLLSLDNKILNKINIELPIVDYINGLFIHVDIILKHLKTSKYSEEFKKI